MKLPLRHIVISIVLICVFTALSGCLNRASHPQEVKVSYWLAYWDMDNGLKEYDKLHDHMASISYFAAYYDKDNKLFIPPEVRQARAQDDREIIKYLSVVNDKAWGGDVYTEKDIRILQAMFADDIELNKQVNAILKLTHDEGFDGVEIDYEKLWNTPSLRDPYIHFIDVLYRHATEQGLKVRVILEPSADFTAPFPTGPEYVVMVYNLYGTHSGPGPKANDIFILTVLQRMQSLPGSKNVAFSTGGCVWSQKESPAFIDEGQAMELAKKYSVVPVRDAGSSALHFEYTDKGTTYTVWYADSATLKHWVAVASQQGITAASIWRLGNNPDIESFSKRS